MIDRWSVSPARVLSTAAMLLLAAAAPLAAQSLFSARGLGFVVEPLDARGRGLGGVGLGLPEPGFSLVNPAGTAGLAGPALHVTVQPDQFDSSYDGQRTRGSTVRFPVLHAVLPYGRGAVSVGYASFLDRNWAVERETTFEVEPGTSLPVRDRFASHGGVARLRLGGHYAPLTRLALGAAIDLYTGAVRDTTYRLFLEGGLQPAFESSAVRFSGVGYAGGVRWVPNEALALGASVAVGGQLDVESEAGGVAASYDLPLQLAGGLSGRVTPTTLVALSGTWAGWSSLDGALPGTGARDTWSLGGGIEWEALRVADRVIPLRLGARHALLPFTWDGTGDGWATERGLTAGAGLRLGGGAAALDASIERGERGGDGAGISESYWRFGLSLTVLGR